MSEMRPDPLAPAGHAEPHDPLREAMPPLKLLFSLQGRIGRGLFWRVGVLGLLLVGLVLTALVNIAGYHGEKADGIVNLLLVWPAVAVSAKRWHDQDKSGWWVLITLIPVIGWIWTLVANGCRAGTPGPNQYGPAPQ